MHILHHYLERTLRNINLCFQAMRTPLRDSSGVALLFQYYNQLYFVERRFFPPDRSLGIYFEWWVVLLVGYDVITLGYWGDLHWDTIHTKFCVNQCAVSKAEVEGQTDIDSSELIYFIVGCRLLIVEKQFLVFCVGRLVHELFWDFMHHIIAVCYKIPFYTA